MVEEVWHTNALMFNLGAEVAKNTKLIGDVENLLFKICRSQGVGIGDPRQVTQYRDVAITCYGQVI